MNSVRELQQEFEIRARALGLSIDCPMDGAFNAQIAVVSEAPGDREVALKVPLVGGSGQLLWKALSKYGITRRDVYVTNVVKRQLSFLEDNDKVRLPKHETDNWEALLKWELASLPNLRYVLVLGNMSLKAICRVDGITRWRGSVLDFNITSHNVTQPRTYKAICTFNPAHVIREPKHEITFMMDVSKLDRVARGKYLPYEIKGHVLTDKRQILEVLEKLNNDKKPISFDIESGSGETACIGFANDSHEGWCIPFRSITGDSYLSLADEMEVRRHLQHLFSSAQNNHFIAQNANFDMYWLWYKDRLRVHRTWFDTMLAHHVLYPTLPHDLGYLTTQYTTHPYYKDDRLEWREKGDIEIFWQYNIKDCCITHEVARRLGVELLDQKLDKFFFEHVMRLQPHLTRMTVGGTLIDVKTKSKIAEELTEQVAITLNDFHEQVGRVTGDIDFRPNPNSPRDISELLFRRLKLVGRGTSTNEVNRKRMSDHPRTSAEARAVIKTLDTYKKDHKFLSTYAEAGIDDDDRMRCEWKQTGVKKAPGRLSSSQVMWGSGMNLQNQPVKARQMFIADPDYVFIYFDLTQAEAQYCAWDWGIESWKDQYTKARTEGTGFDSHRALAAQMFKMEYEQTPIKDHDANGVPTIRFKAKRARHGLNYRMAPDRFAEASGLPLSEAIELYTIYHRLHPEIRRGWASTEKEVRDTKTLFNAYGRRLMFLERLNTDDAMESVVAFKPQSSIGDKVSRVIYMSHDDPAWPDRHARIALNVHDALIGLAHKDRAMDALRIMKKHAEEPMMVRGEQLIIAAEPGISQPDETGIHRWSTIKKVQL